MKRFYQLVALVAIAMFNAIGVVTGGMTTQKMMPSGVINQGILGGFSGKVGPVVGGNWKDIDYMRSYVIPANPNSSAQQAVRAKFAALVSSARQVLASLLQPYWDPFYSSMSGFNAFISQNYSLSEADGELNNTCLMSKGTLFSGTGITQALINGSNIDIDYSTVVSGNAAGTDGIVIVLFHQPSLELEVFEPTETRADGSLSVTPTIGMSEDDPVWLFFVQGTGSSMIVSDSTEYDTDI